MAKKVLSARCNEHFIEQLHKLTSKYDVSVGEFLEEITTDNWKAWVEKRKDKLRKIVDDVNTM